MSFGREMIALRKILVVDDEPRVSTGIKNFLLGSDLDIAHVETALNGFEALDYLRMDAYDLVLTDIQMSMMNGIELMEAIYLEQPHIPIIVISAHEKFEFAKKSLRLGARDYLIKPVELGELIRVVKQVLFEKESAGRKLLDGQSPRPPSAEPAFGERKKAMIELIAEEDLGADDYAALEKTLGNEKGQTHYGVIAVVFDMNRVGFSDKEISLRDRKLLKFATVNIVEESLSDWRGIAFYGLGNRLIAAIQLRDEEVADREVQVKSQLNLIGQLLCVNLKQYLNVDAVVGMSTLSAEAASLPKLLERAQAAVDWRKQYPGNRVLYYGDMLEREREREEAEEIDQKDSALAERDNSIIAQVTDFIGHNYRDRGLKVQDIAAAVHFSPAYVSFLFKQIMKKNVWEYVTAVRIEEAKRLLGMTDMKRYEIAYQVGYESPEHFSRIFKRSVGLSPADYRKDRQGGSD